MANREIQDANNATACSKNILDSLRTLIQDAKGFVIAIKDAKGRHYELENELEDCRRRLEIWMEAWRLNDQSNVQYYKVLWGDSSSSIKNRLEGIRSFVDSIEERLKPMKESEPGICEKFIFTELQAGVLDKDITRIKNLLHSLQVDAVTAFNRCHKTEIADTPPNKLLDSTTMSWYSKLAVVAIKCSEELYRSYEDARRGFHFECVNLDLDISGEKFGFRLSDISKMSAILARYDFHISWRSQLVQLIIEGLYPEKEQLRPQDDTFMVALNDVLLGKPHHFGLSCAPPKTKFVSKPSAEGPSCREESVESLLKGSSAIGYDDEFPMDERIWLSFKVSECGFLLTGASWFAGMSSNSVKRLTRDACPPHRYTIDLGTKIEEAGKRAVRDLDTHLARIGILLASIGLDCTVEPVGHDALPDSTEDGRYRLGKPGGDEGQEITWAELKSLLVDKLGDRYANAVDFCLNRNDELWAIAYRSPGPHKQAYHSIIFSYYFQVYRPMQELVEIDEWASD